MFLNKIDELLENLIIDNFINAKKINFIGVDGYDVYNIASPFKYKDKYLIAGRVEKRDSEDSKVMFFEKVDKTNYRLIKSIKSFNLQDPYITITGDEIILGGTKVEFKDGSVSNYYVEKYIGTDLNNMNLFFKGPDKMKDIRLCFLEKNKILCLTRPQGEYGGRGKIGYFILDDLYNIDQDKIKNAPLLPLFNDVEWGGANQIIKLSDSSVVVLGHVARFDENGDRNYYVMTFELDIDTFKISNYKIILKRDMLPSGEFKRPDLVDVLFPGGINKINEEICEIYVGASDAEAYIVNYKNPFIQDITLEFNE